MTPEQTIKYEILLDASENEDILLPEYKITKENINETYKNLLIKEGLHWDYQSEFRGNGERSNIEPEWSRDYETISVALKLRQGVWVGWTYWFGGGKFGNPESVPWMDEAYFLECSEHEETIVIREFTKKEK